MNSNVDAVCRIQSLIEKLDKLPVSHPKFSTVYHASNTTQIESIKRSLTIFIERECRGSIMRETFFNQLKDIKIRAVNLTDNEGEAAIPAEFDEAKTLLLDLMHEIKSDLIVEIPLKKESIKEDSEMTSKTSESDAVEKVCRICTRFKLVADQLRERYDKREPLIIKDEYDVQDLFHALLKLYFDDIRREEPAPSTAGSSSRIDFLLTRERILIETKMPRLSLADKRLKEELSIDLKCYQKHPGFDTLIFFVYDPDKCIKNPGAFETDFNENRGDICVRFSIRQ